jgi:hypothetical protein
LHQLPPLAPVALESRLAIAIYPSSKGQGLGRAQNN